jgi:primosomal protein N' (replication factor Y)
MTPARRRVLDALDDGLLHPRADVALDAGVSASVIDGLVDEGTLAAEVLPPETPDAPDPDFAAPAFSSDQAQAADTLRALVAAGEFKVALLDGVTGSGKTEVYFEAIAENLRRGRQALVLMPEIALTGQFLDRFAGRFGVRPVEWHSELTPRRRARNWAAVADGAAQVVVGARSALLLPYANLGLIIVDEEHDAAYKQDEGVHYHARDMAVVRGRIAGLPVVLASATPSVETEVNARRGRYQRVALPSRFGGAVMPHIEAIDLTREPPPRGRYIAPRLVAAVRDAVENREQALLFLNRRGYAPLTLCRACGHRFACSSCDAWLVEHRFRARLVCHHCGFSMPRPPICPHCGAEDSLAACGPGVERLEEEVASLFPDARTLVLSSDRIASIDKMREELASIAEGRVDIIIGTQLVAKGHHFPRLNLVGVVDADLGLNNGDPRAAERTFQLLNQVIGRAGREAGNGHGRSIGYLQTHQPQHPVMQALIACDRAAFYESEIALRETTAYPPFGRLAALIVSAGERPMAEGYARRLAMLAPADDAVRVLGPAEAPLAVLRGRHRFRLLAKSPRGFDLSGYVRAWIALAPAPKGTLKLEIDIDPYSFF